MNRRRRPQNSGDLRPNRAGSLARNVPYGRLRRALCAAREKTRPRANLIDDRRRRRLTRKLYKLALSGGGGGGAGSVVLIGADNMSIFACCFREAPE